MESMVTQSVLQKEPCALAAPSLRLSPRGPPAGTCGRQICAQKGTRPSVCTQTRTQALPNTNIYLRFTVLENLVNNVNDESLRLAENIVRAASLKFSLSCTLGNTHAV